MAGIESIGAILKIGLLGHIIMRSASIIASVTPGAGSAFSDPSKKDTGHGVHSSPFYEILLEV